MTAASRVAATATMVGRGGAAARAATRRARGAILGTTFDRNSSGTSHPPGVTTAGADSRSVVPLTSTSARLRVTTTRCRPRTSRARALALVQSGLARSAAATRSSGT